MATYHRGTGQPVEKDLNLQDQDIDIPNDYQHEDIDYFENVEKENHTRLRDLTNKVDVSQNWSHRRSVHWCYKPLRMWTP